MMIRVTADGQAATLGNGKFLRTKDRVKSAYSYSLKGGGRVCA